MSSTTYDPSAVATSIVVRSEDDLGSNHFSSSPFDNHLLSPFDHSQTLSNSASPSYNTDGTPAASSEYSHCQSSELSDLEDPFFGVNFDDGVHRVDSLPTKPILGNVAYQNQNRAQSKLVTHVENQQHSITPNPAQHPISPANTNNSHTSSPNGAANGIRGVATIRPNDLTTDLYNSRFPQKPPAALYQTVVEVTPDHSDSSHTSGEDLEMHRSPKLMVSQWPSSRPTSEANAYFGDNYSQPRSKDFGGGASNHGQKLQGSISRDDEGSWMSNVETGQSGLDPAARRQISNAEVPSLRQQADQDRINIRNDVVLDWRSHTAGSSDSEDEQTVRRIVNSAPQPPADMDEIHPIVDSGIRENRIVPGQVYFYPGNGTLNDADRELMNQSRHWFDPPTMPHITTDTAYQPETSIEAIQRFNRNADAFSIISRQATWGTQVTQTTRRRSEPTMADLEGISNGSLLKKLSISKSKDSTRKDSLFESGLAGLANIVRKRSSSNLKRSRSSQNIPEETTTSPRPRKESQSSLAPPRGSSYSSKAKPSIHTAFADMTGALSAVGATHARSGSISGTNTSPKSPSHLGLPRPFFGGNRARSKSEISMHEKTGLADLWRGQGGPPLPTLAAPATETKKADIAQTEGRDLDEDEDEDDELADEIDMKEEIETEPIIPSYDGFKAHVRRLNPDMDSRCNWLVSRIAHQQEIRYKNLLDLRVKHQQAIANRSCSAMPHCLSLGGSVILTDARGNPRDNGGGLQILTDFQNSDDDSNPGEGALTDETFPPGVPMPPTRNLPAEFECQLCFKAKRFQKPSDWTKHVHEDVQPFTCTYDKCKEPKSFKRKADWVRHENERHRHLEWWICQVDDCRHPCYRKDNFLQHLVREHKLPEPKQKTKAAIKKARLTEPAWQMLEACHHETQNRPQDEPCKFCGKAFLTWKKLTVHLAKHMEHISLPVLGLVEDKHVDANTIISPIEQIVTPITPNSRTKMESSASPSHMYSLSSHVPAPFPDFDHGNEYHNPQSSFANQTNGYGLSFQGMNTSNQTQSIGRQASTFIMEPPNQQGYNLDLHTQNLYANNYAVQPARPRALSNASPLNPHPMPQPQAREFGSMDSSFPLPKVEARDFSGGSLGLDFSSGQNYNTHSNNGFSMAQTFSGSPAVSGYTTNNLMGMTDPNYGFEGVNHNTTQGFQGQGFGQQQVQVPMSRGQGSSSSYSHSPNLNQGQNVPYYHP